MKTCFKCHLEKPLTDFYKHKGMADGHLGKCKECTKSDVKQNRRDKPEQYRLYELGRTPLPHRREARRIYNKVYRKIYPDRDKAQTMVSNAIRDGRLFKSVCWVCGEQAEAHHPDYSKPLDVVWLCRKHHKETHNSI